MHLPFVSNMIEKHHLGAVATLEPFCTTRHYKVCHLSHIWENIDIVLENKTRLLENKLYKNGNTIIISKNNKWYNLC